jgi:hypothetical protein
MNKLVDVDYPNGNKMIENELFDNGKRIVKFYLSSGELWTKHLLSKDENIIFAEYYNKNQLYDKRYHL